MNKRVVVTEAMVRRTGMRLWRVEGLREQGGLFPFSSGTPQENLQLYPPKP